jgi:hypothetical protein
MRIQVYLGLLVVLSGTSLAQSGADRTVSVQSASTAPLAGLMAASSGHGLTLTECQARIERLGTHLGSGSYGPRRERQFAEGNLVTWWYSASTQTAVVVWMNASGAAHDLEVAELPWDRAMASGALYLP